MKRLRIEIWRIMKFLLISEVVNIALSHLFVPLMASLTIQPAAGALLSFVSYVRLFLCAAILALLHRYFTFRATEPWFIALPLMLLYALLWQLLTALPMTFAARQSDTAVHQMSLLLYYISLILQYLFQRYVIYSHTTDTNGWYRRFHPDTE